MVDKKTGLKPKKTTAKNVDVKDKKITEEPRNDTKDAVNTEELTDDTGTKIIAKAGKRSLKAIEEAAEKAAKEERKAAAGVQSQEKPKVAVKPPRSREERAGKKYRGAAKLVDKSKDYPLAEAIELAVKTNPAKFDATVEMHFNLNVDPKQADQNIRDTVNLPSGTGKTLRIAVFAEAQDVESAKAAGADIAGIEDVTALLDKEQLDFDVLIAPPALMAQLGKYARFLGPRGLMPNPKSGTVTKDLAKAVKEAKGGRVEYRVDQAGIVHLAIGKTSFGSDKLAANAEAVLTSLKSAKPASVKGALIKSAYITTTMGPSIKLGL